MRYRDALTIVRPLKITASVGALAEGTLGGIHAARIERRTRELQFSCRFVIGWR